jgi:hypothetical protein
VALVALSCTAKSESVHPDASLDAYRSDVAQVALTSVAAITAANCALAGCHDPITKGHGMDLSTAEGVYVAWVDKPGFDHCGNVPKTRVVPGDPTASFVMSKVTATESCGLSDPMPPPPRARLTATEIETIRVWIAAGAPRGAALVDGGADTSADGPSDAETDAETDALADGGSDDVDPNACTASIPCLSGSNCTADSCAGPWTCVYHFDETLEHPCSETVIPFCGCDGVTFEASETCPDRPWVHAGACGDGVNCNAQEVKCSDPKPTCNPGQEASVVGDCWGKCVDIAECRCLYHWQCPNLSLYTCLFPQYRCGPQPPRPDAGSDGP